MVDTNLEESSSNNNNPIQQLEHSTAASKRSGSKVYQLEEHLLDIFVDSCLFERASGYSEKSIAYFQALIEFNCFCPSRLIDYHQQLRGFESFWDSETPRIGDEVIIIF